MSDPALARFAALMQQVRSGSDEAARELLELYSAHVCRIIRRRLGRELRSKYDSDDFAQAVWASFFANREMACQFEQPEALMAFLARLASNKLIDQRRHLAAAKRNISRERSLDGSSLAADRTLAGDQPTPSQFAIANEQWERLTADQPSHYRRILALRAGGATHQEIAAELGVSTKTVQRVLEKLARRVQN